MKTDVLEASPPGTCSCAYAHPSEIHRSHEILIQLHLTLYLYVDFYSFMVHCS